MAITTQVDVDLASVEVTDEYRVELTQLRKVLDYSPDQARQLGKELIQAAREAEHAFTQDQERHFAAAVAKVPTTINGEVVL